MPPPGHIHNSVTVSLAACEQVKLPSHVHCSILCTRHWHCDIDRGTDRVLIIWNIGTKSSLDISNIVILKHNIVGKLKNTKYNQRLKLNRNGILFTSRFNAQNAIYLWKLSQNRNNTRVKYNNIFGIIFWVAFLSFWHPPAEHKWLSISTISVSPPPTLNLGSCVTSRQLRP